MKKSKRLGFVLLLAGLVLLNYAASLFHARYDLTEEKRYTLSPQVKTMLANLQEPVQVEVFLKGDYPAGFRKLANSIEEFLQECKEYGKTNLQIEFKDPLKGLGDSAAQRLMDSVAYFYNITPLTLQAPTKAGDEQTQKLVLPGGVIHYRDTTVGINLLQGERGFGTEPEQLAALYNNVEASMEYRFASAIEKATAEKKYTVGYALGHGEGWGYNVDDAVRTLFKSYNTDTINIKTAPLIPQVDALVIVKPLEKFSDADKIKIDQYVMHGGKVFWMIDNMYAEFDSLYKSGGFVAFDRGLNLEDLLFNYGVRINQSLLQDIQCDRLPQPQAPGAATQLQTVAWPYFPVLNGTGHPISKNLDGVRCLFPETIDTVEATGIKKTFLLRSSGNARLVQAPEKIDFNYLQIAPDIKQFRLKELPVAVLLEGKFTSLYAPRISKATKDSMAAVYNYTVLPAGNDGGKMIIVADGDLAMNGVSQQYGPLKMGENLYTHYVFSNKDFFINSLEYLINPSNILQTRAKQYTLRLLDTRQAAEEKTTWQAINILLPVMLVIAAGIIYQQVRRRKYGPLSPYPPAEGGI